MNRKLMLSLTAVVSVAGLLTACGGSDAGSDEAAATASDGSGLTIPTSIDTTAGSGTLTVDGQKVQMKSLTCAAMGDGHQIGGGEKDGSNFVGVTLSGDTPPKVTTLALKVGGTTLGAVPGISGEAEVKVDGDQYTITGEAQGVNLENITDGLQKKTFEIKVTCEK